MTKRLADEAISLLQAALHRRGLQAVTIVNNVEDGALPPEPNINTVPYLHYGAVGLNALEGYDTAIFIHGYYVPDEVLAAAVFPHLPPSKRPKPRISARGGRRSVTWTGVISDQDKQLAEVMLFRLEADPALQAFGRVRYTIHPRTVVMSIQHNVLPRIGRVKTMKNLATARAELGLNDTVAERHGQQAKRLRELMGAGQTLAAAACTLGIPYRSAKRLAAAHDLRGGQVSMEGIVDPVEKGPNTLYIECKVSLAPFRVEEPPQASGHPQVQDPSTDQLPT